MALFIRDEDVVSSVDMGGMLTAIEDMLRHHGLGEAANVARSKVIGPTGMLSFMGSGLHYAGVVGVKTYTTVAGGHSFHTTLYDAATGRLLAFVQANRLGKLRTGATTAIAAKYLARRNAGVLGIIGTGSQAPAQVEALAKVLALRQVRAFSRDRSRREAFARDMCAIVQVEVVPTESAWAAVDGCDVVVCITTSPEPVLSGDWLSDGYLLVSAGPTSWREWEVDDASLLRASSIVVDSLEQAKSESGELAGAAERGLVQWERVVELRQVVAGLHPGRTSREDNVYVKLTGTGVADVAAAKLAYDRARELGLGTELDF